MLKGGNNIFCVASVTFLLFVIGCTPKVRSFFFDGVPVTSDTVKIASADPADLPDTIMSTDIAAIAKKPLIYYHPPYENKKCKICHDPSSALKLVQEQQELCKICHDDYNSEYRFVHGPVGGGLCTSCHAPHQSENNKLLLRTGHDLCLFCHNPADIYKNGIHKDDESADCQDCHDPHGSNKKYLLKQ